MNRKTPYTDAPAPTAGNEKKCQGKILAKNAEAFFVQMLPEKYEYEMEKCFSAG